MYIKTRQNDLNNLFKNIKKNNTDRRIISYGRFLLWKFHRVLIPDFLREYGARLRTIGRRAGPTLFTWQLFH